MAIHQLPAYVSALGLNNALLFYHQIVSDPDRTVICDARHLNFVDPAGLCLLAATCHQLSEAGKRLELVNVPDNISSYLARMDLFRACGIAYEENFERHDRRADLVELRMLTSQADVEPLSHRIADTLVGQMPDYDPTAERDEMSGYLPHQHVSIPLQYIFSELLENAITHGRRAGHRSAVAWIAAQYYPSNDRIRVAVVDNGCGFLSSLSSHPRLVDRQHWAAIRLALEPRITCNPALRLAPGETVNQGVGLTMVKEIAAASRGDMRLASGDHAIALYKSGRDFSTGIAPWQGVMLALDLERDRLRSVKIHEVLARVLAETGDAGLRFV